VGVPSLRGSAIVQGGFSFFPRVAPLFILFFFSCTRLRFLRFFFFLFRTVPFFDLWRLGGTHGLFVYVAAEAFFFMGQAAGHRGGMQDIFSPREGNEVSLTSISDLFSLVLEADLSQVQSCARTSLFFGLHAISPFFFTGFPPFGRFPLYITRLTSNFLPYRCRIPLALFSIKGFNEWSFPQFALFFWRPHINAAHWLKGRILCPLSLLF